MFRPIVGQRYRVLNPAEEPSLEKHEGTVVKTTTRIVFEGTDVTDCWVCERIDTGEELRLYNDELEEY